MSVSASFKNSKTFMLMQFVLERCGASDDYDEVLQHALDEGWIKTSKPRQQTQNSTPKDNKDKTKGQSKWTAFQMWCKKWSAWNDKTIDRKTMKEIYENYTEAEKAEWQRVADELNSGKNIRDIENKPKIQIPQKEENSSSQETVEEPENKETEPEPEQNSASQETVQETEPEPEQNSASQETVQETEPETEFEKADLNGDNLVDKAEWDAYHSKKEEEKELSEVEKLKAQLAAAEAKIAEK